MRLADSRGRIEAKAAFFRLRNLRVRVSVLIPISERRSFAADPNPASGKVSIFVVRNRFEPIHAAAGSGNFQRQMLKP